MSSHLDQLDYVFEEVSRKTVNKITNMHVRLEFNIKSFFEIV